MHRSIPMLVLLLLGLGLRAQDLIVTTSGDSIRCAITSVGPYRLAYTRRTDDGKERGRIALKEVASYKRVGYYNVVLGKVEDRDHTVLPAGNKWMFAVGGGWSYRTSALEEGLSQQGQDYVNGLRQGYHAAASLQLALSARWSVGVIYNSFFGARNTGDVSVLLPDSSTITGPLSDDVRIKWVGLDVCTWSEWAGRMRLHGSFGIGPVFYRNYATVIDEYIIRGTYLALRGGFGVDYRLTDALSFGIEAGYIHGRVREFSVDRGSHTYTISLPPRSSEGIHRVDAGVVLRVRL